MSSDEFDLWADAQRGAPTQDLVWRFEAYRLAAFLQHVAWQDCRTLSRTSITRSVADQLYRAIGSIGANIAEGFSRSSRRDRVRFYEYALGSARECVSWYRGSQPVLREATVSIRLERLQQVIRLLLRMIRTDRGAT